jgi:hypothetical protein
MKHAYRLLLVLLMSLSGLIQGANAADNAYVVSYADALPASAGRAAKPWRSEVLMPSA